VRGLILIAALGVIFSPRAAAACDQDQLSHFSSRCLNAMEVSDYGAASVWCQSVAEQFGICSDETTGSLHYGYMALKARSLAAASVANSRYDRETSTRQLHVARLLAMHVLRSRSADRDGRHLANDVLKLHY
jgi:hypothetical protein